MATELNSLDSLTADWRRLKAQKSRKTGGIEGRCLVNLGFVLGEQHITHRDNGIYSEPHENNKLYLVFNMIRPRLNKLLGRLTAGSQTFTAQPTKRDSVSLANADVVMKLDRALDKKLNQPARLWEALWWCAIGGTAFIHTPWIPDHTTESNPVISPTGEVMYEVKATGEELPESEVELMVGNGAPVELFQLKEELTTIGEVGCEVYGPLNVFIDQGVRAIEDLSPDQMVYVASVRTTGWVERNFNKQVKPQSEIDIVSTAFHQLGPSVGGYFLKDIIPLIQGSGEDDHVDDKGNVTVVMGYGPASPTHPQGRFVVFIPGVTMLHDAPNPYEEIPIVDLHWQPVTASFWTSDYVSDLIAPQKFINKRLSQLGEQANASVYSQLLLGGGLKTQDIPADWPGVIENGLADSGAPNVARLAGPELPSWFLPATQKVLEMFNDIAGAGDLFKESKFPGQLRGSEAVPALQEILDTEWGPLFEHIGERMARVKQQRLNRVKQFYPETRTLHYVDKNLKDETLEFHRDAILGRGVNYHIAIERTSLLPELRSVREFRLNQRLQGPLAILYTDERTGMLDKNKIAAELEFGDTGRQDRQSHYRKLSRHVIEMIWDLKQPPQPMPFWDHRSMLDELEAEMSTTEFLGASPEVQQMFIAQYEAHRAFIMQEAQQQQASMQSGAVNNAVAMATQQAAASAAAMAVEQAMGVAQAQQQAPTDQIMGQALSQTGAGR
jgi:hypothetical protein